MNAQCLALSMPGTGEWLIIGLVALLLFGRRLPEVARSLGQSVVSFKKGLRDLHDEVNTSDSAQRRIDAPKDAEASVTASKDAARPS